jgi:YVTN family beta-propeller protein
VAVNPATNKIYIANLGTNSVTVIDGANDTTVQVGVGTDPQELAINPTTNKICVTNQESNDVTVIDGVTNNTTTVPAGNLPDAVAANPTTHHFYVANQTSNDVTVINVGSQSIRHSTSAADITRSTSVTNRSGTRLTAANSFPWSPGATGYDISWPQCGGPFPPPAEIAIVGATSGYLNVGPNPCYIAQVAWAGAGLSSYIVASPLPSPAPPESMSGPYGTCSGNVVCQSGNFGYYWGQHWISYSRSLGISPNVWWLDVEIGKGWNTSPAAYATNNAVINGALAGMRAMGVTVGIYATSYQWGVITGNQLSYPGIPLWVPGGTTLANDPKSAMAICTGTIPNYVPFAGGNIVLVQYGYINGPPYPFDLNFACVTHTATYAGPAVASWAQGRLDLFARGADNAIWQAFFNAGRWSGWVSQGGTVVSDPAAVSWGPNRVDVFGVGSDGRLWQRFWDGRAWIGWMSPFGAPPPGIAPGSGPAVASWAPGRLDVFVRGTDNAIWQVVWSGGRWSGWVSQGGTVVSDPAAVSWGPNRVDVFGVGSDGRLWQRVWDGRAWSNWVRPFALPPAGIAPGSGPAASSRAPGQLDVLVRGADNGIWQIFWNAGWSSWISQGRIIVSNPAAVSQSVNQIDLFGTGSDGRIYQKAWNGRAWSAWVSTTGRPPPGVAVTNP